MMSLSTLAHIWTCINQRSCLRRENNNGRDARVKVGVKPVSFEEVFNDDNQTAQEQVKIISSDDSPFPITWVKNDNLIVVLLLFLRVLVTQSRASGSGWERELTHSRAESFRVHTVDQLTSSQGKKHRQTRMKTHTISHEHIIHTHTACWHRLDSLRTISRLYYRLF